MSGDANSATGFPANLQIGVAMAAESNNPRAAQAWQTFKQRSGKPNYRDNANFAVIRR